jgi:LysM repeat protein
LTRSHSRTGTSRRLSQKKAFLGKGEDALLARLERYLYALTAMLVLWAVVVAVTPAVAQAQETAPTKDTKDTNSNTAERIVVSSGDSLWSISSEWLGPTATPRQVAIGVERIYALNQDRIGSDPNLIFPGQKLLLPAVGQPSRAKESGAVAPARGATKPAEASTRDPGPEKASKTPLNKEAKPVALPEMPPQQAAPKVGSPTTATDAPSPIESFVSTTRSLLSSATSAVVGLFAQDDRFGGRRLLGLGIIAFTLLVTGLIAWKMPLRRNAGGFEVYGSIPRPAPTSRVSEPDSGRFVGGEASAVENGLNGAAGMIVAAQRRKHLRRARSFTTGRTATRSPRLRGQSLSPKRGRL